MTTDSKDLTLWEKIIKFFKNTWIGVLILAVLAISNVISNHYDQIKTYQADNNNKLINNRLIELNDLISERIKGRYEADSIRFSLKEYLGVRNSLNELPSSDVKKKEADLLIELLNYVHLLLDKYFQVVKLNQTIDVLKYRHALVPICNEILNFCEKTSTCSSAEVNTLKTTINALHNN